MRGVEAVEGATDEVDVLLDDLRRVPDVVLALTTRGARLTRVAAHDRSLEELYFAVRAPHLAATPFSEGTGSPTPPPPPGRSTWARSSPASSPAT